MQFYLDGYRTGDPFVSDPHPTGSVRPDELPDKVDVLIIGAGPAGLVLAAQLANFPEITTLVIDRRPGTLAVGQADGLACRTMEMLEAFGLANGLIQEGYSVNEVAFWRPDPKRPDEIARAERIADVEEGLSEMPHVIVNQARVLEHLLGHMARSASRSAPRYGLQAAQVEVDDSVSSEYPVSVAMRHGAPGDGVGTTSMIRAKYVVGCDGSHSITRAAIGRELIGDTMNKSWGVLDAFVVTDFPDIRLKCTVHSANHGSVLIIPREGGYMVRFYVELNNARDREMLADRSVAPEKLVAVVNRIMHPYTVDLEDVGWWAVYEIGQRLCEKFDDVAELETQTRLPRVFIAGDACHTHSAKAGQGMNVSMNDAWNLGWKLAAVLRGTAAPALLHTYSEERQKVAAELIAFDRAFAAMFSASPAGARTPDDGPAEFQRYFIEQGRFTAGVQTRYAPSLITAGTTHQHLAPGFPVGMRFHSAPVVRLADAKPVHLGHAARADGAWRLYLFGDRSDPTDPASALWNLCRFLGTRESPVVRYTPVGADPDRVIDVRAVFQQGHRDLAIGRMPPVLLPRKGRFSLTDYEKMYCPDPRSDNVFDLRGIDRERGAMVLVRPDQHVAQLLPLQEHEALCQFLARFMIDGA